MEKKNLEDFLLYILVDNTNKARPPSEGGGRLGNSHPFRAKNKYLLMIWTIWLLETAAAWSLTPHERGGCISLAGPRDTRVQVDLLKRNTEKLGSVASIPHPNFLGPVLNFTWNILSTSFKLNIIYFLLGFKVDYIFSLTFRELMIRGGFLGIHFMEDPGD